ncbi:hypothetical protein Tco_0756317 [Tanacetum coccineum]
MKAASYPDFGLKLLVPEQMWIDDVCTYDISAKYGTSHWWFTRQKFYIDKHDSPSRHKDVRTHMRILSVVRIKAYSRYGYDYLSEISFEELISKNTQLMKKDFKNLQTDAIYCCQAIEAKLSDSTAGYEFKHDYTIIESSRAVVFPRVKEFKVKRLNPGMNTRFWTQKDVKRSKEFISAIERLLKTRRIYQNLECFIGGRVRDIDYRLLQRTE